MPKFTPRQRKQKHRQRDHANAPVDTNVAEIQPVSKSEKEAKRQKLREELRSQHTNVSAKKQKRLDKYIVRYSALELADGGMYRSLNTADSAAGEQTEEGREPRTFEETRSVEN